MRKIFLLLACLCGLGFGEDSPKCGELMRLTPELREMSKEFTRNGDWDEVSEDTGEIIGTVKCTEIIECNKEKYCISYISPSRGKSSFFDPIHHE